MLKLAAKHYLKSMGDHAFAPIPDYPEFSFTNCLDVVIKRKPTFFFQRPIYTYDNFGLNDLLDVPLPNDISVYLRKPEPLSPDYVYKSKHHIKSQMGSKIASLVSLDIETDDVITFEIELKGVVKQSIDFSAVQKALSERKVNLKGKYLPRLAQNKHNVVCLVSQYLYINQPLDIKVTVNDELKGSGDVSKSKYVIKDDGSIQANLEKSIKFDIGTKIAFQFAECLISPDGQIELIDASDSVKRKPMIPEMLKLALLPNYCAHITVDNQSFDMPDSKIKNNMTDLFHTLSSALNHQNINNIKIHLISLAIENRNLFTKLELFIMHCIQETVDKEIEIETLMIFEREMLKNVSLIEFFKNIQLRVEGLQVYVRAVSLEKSFLEGILGIMQIIYHLEVPHLKNLQTILKTYDTSKIEELAFFLLNLKFLAFRNDALYNSLVEDRNMKTLLRAVGVNEDESEPNEYFELMLTLLYGH